jgi:RNA-directed DNA polymerase
LERAWELVRANRGAAGIDKQTIADVEQHGANRMLDELAADLKDRRWRPLPAVGCSSQSPGVRSFVRSRSQRSATVSCRRR